MAFLTSVSSAIFSPRQTLIYGSSFESPEEKIWAGEINLLIYVFVCVRNDYSSKRFNRNLANAALLSADKVSRRRVFFIIWVFVSAELFNNESVLQVELLLVMRSGSVLFVT